MGRTVQFKSVIGTKEKQVKQYEHACADIDSKDTRSADLWHAGPARRESMKATSTDPGESR